MDEPRASRPYMPGYGLRGPDEGTGLLPWDWAAQRLAAARNYWLVTVRPDGWPHAMPVWAVWQADALWLSSSLGSRKVRNLLADPRCVLATEDAADPVVVEGTGELVTEPAALANLLGLMNAKYQTDYSIELLDPAVNATVRMRPARAFALRHDDFTGSPTRWTFGVADRDLPAGPPGR